MQNPYLNAQQFANHIIHMSKLIKNVEQLSPSLALELKRGIAKLEHHNNALESQIETIERMSVMK